MDDDGSVGGDLRIVQDAAGDRDDAAGTDLDAVQHGLLEGVHACVGHGRIGEHTADNRQGTAGLELEPGRRAAGRDGDAAAGDHIARVAAVPDVEQAALFDREAVRPAVGIGADFAAGISRCAGRPVVDVEIAAGIVQRIKLENGALILFI